MVGLAAGTQLKTSLPSHPLEWIWEDEETEAWRQQSCQKIKGRDRSMKQKWFSRFSDTPPQLLHSEHRPEKKGRLGEERRWGLEQTEVKVLSWHQLPISNFFKTNTTSASLLVFSAYIDLCKLPAFGGLHIFLIEVANYFFIRQFRSSSFTPDM